MAWSARAERGTAVRTRVARYVWIVSLATAAVASGYAAAPRSARPPAPPPPPNILFVLADDLDVASLAFMPQTLARVAAEGATFDRYLVNNSLCCPSRMTILRGQYAHGTGIESNRGIHGGFERAYASGIESRTIATRLEQAGYRTGLFGKYLNGYPNGAPENYVPPGWTTWASPLGGDPYAEYGYVLNEDRVLRSYGKEPSAYGTDVYVGMTARFIEGAARDRVPFFAYLAVFAPHAPATPAPSDTTLFPDARAPRTPSFDQADVSRMPCFIAHRPRLSNDDVIALDSLYRARLQSLQSLDRGIASLMDTLAATGQLANTYVMFSSDNGFHLGQHRLPAGKETAYDTDVRVPLVVRGPGIPAGRHVAALAGNVDLAPTFAAMAGIRPGHFTDGRSLLAFARAVRGAARRWRTAYLIEHRVPDFGAEASRSAREHGSGPLEPDDRDQMVARGARAPTSCPEVPTYHALRTNRYLYVEYVTGERELYDTRTDPDQTNNLAGRGHRRLRRALAARLAALRGCHAERCRRLESRPLRRAPARDAS